MTLPDCEIFDAHHHLGYKPSFANGQFTVRELIDHLDRKHVQRALAMHFISPLRSPGDFAQANEYVAEALTYSPTRLVGGVVVNPIYRDLALEEVERYHQLGFAAIKLHPAFHHYQINSPAVDEVAELGGKLGLPLLIHSDFSSDVCSPYEIVRLARRFENTTFIMAHFGMQPQLCARVPEIVGEVENVVLDTSQTADFPWEIYVNPVRVLGPHRLLFGSDGPECDITVNLRKLEVAIEDYGLEQSDATQILAGNAARLFGVNVPNP